MPVRTGCSLCCARVVMFDTLSCPIVQTYISMATAAIKALKERGGSSSAAIKKYIIANNAGLAFAQHSLRMALKKGVKDGFLAMVKASYKLTDKVCSFYFKYSTATLVV